MTYDDKLDNVFCKIEKEAVLEQLIEEAGELIQASAKHLRIMRGVNPTPITRGENIKNLEEEIADVQLCIDLTIQSLRCDSVKTQKEIEFIKQQKLSRWLDRLEIKEE